MAEITPERLASSGTEHGHQSALFCWSHSQEVKEQYPLLDTLLFYAIPNGGARGDTKKSCVIRGGQLSAEGVKSGVPDTFLSVARGGWFGFYIEMKKPEGKPSKEQLDFKKLAEEQGYLWAYYDNWIKAKDALIYYISLQRTKIFD